MTQRAAEAEYLGAIGFEIFKAVVTIVA